MGEGGKAKVHHACGLMRWDRPDWEEVHRRVTATVLVLVLVLQFTPLAGIIVPAEHSPHRNLENDLRSSSTHP